jgi:hypothetical protein
MVVRRILQQRMRGDAVGSIRGRLTDDDYGSPKVSRQDT